MSGADLGVGDALERDVRRPRPPQTFCSQLRAGLHRRAEAGRVVEDEGQLLAVLGADAARAGRPAGGVEGCLGRVEVVRGQVAGDGVAGAGAQSGATRPVAGLPVPLRDHLAELGQVERLRQRLADGLVRAGQPGLAG